MASLIFIFFSFPPPFFFLTPSTQKTISPVQEQYIGWYRDDTSILKRLFSFLPKISELMKTSVVSLK